MPSFSHALFGSEFCDFPGLRIEIGSRGARHFDLKPSEETLPERLLMLRQPPSSPDFA